MHLHAETDAKRDTLGITFQVHFSKEFLFKANEQKEKTVTNAFFLTLFGITVKKQKHIQIGSKIVRICDHSLGGVLIGSSVTKITEVNTRQQMLSSCKNEISNIARTFTLICKGKS